jgi:stress response protein YsnF
MIFSKFGDNHSGDAQLSGSDDIRQFEVYTDRDERIGTVIDLLTNQSDHSKFLVVDVEPWATNKHIVLPLNYVLIDRRLRRFLVIGLSKAQVLELPAYGVDSTSRATSYHNEPVVRTQSHPLTLDSESLESSAPLEYAAPLDFEETVYSTVRASTPIEKPLADIGVSANKPVIEPHSSQELSSDRINKPDYQFTEPTHPLNDSISAPKVVEEEKVRLLEERLVVDRKKRKIGEVIVRKEIETQIVEIPVRREKLIVEQISPERKQLASFALGQPEPDGVKLAEASSSVFSEVSGEFTSAKAASQFLDAIANRPESGYQKIEIRIVLENPELQEIYQQWLDHYSAHNRIQFEP